MRTLSTIEPGCLVEVRSVVGHDERRQLHELGLGAGRTVRVLCSGDPLMCVVGECRVGICKRLARCVYVELRPEEVR